MYKETTGLTKVGGVALPSTSGKVSSLHPHISKRSTRDMWLAFSSLDLLTATRSLADTELRSVILFSCAVLHTGTDHLCLSRLDQWHTGGKARPCTSRLVLLGSY